MRRIRQSPLTRNVRASFEKIRSGCLRHLQLTYVVALTILAAVALLSHGIMDRTIEARSGDAHVLDVAGSQRVLSQKIAKLSVQLAEARSPDFQPESLPNYENAHLENLLRHAHRRFLDAHHALQFGDAAFDLPPLDDEQVADMFVKLQPHVDAIDAEVQTLLSDRTQDHPQALARLLKHESKFLAAENDIVNTLKNHATTRIAHLQSVAVWLLVLTLALLAAIGLFVFEPVRRLLQRQLDELASANDQMVHEARHDTLTALPNRAALMDHLQALCAARKDPQTSDTFAVCFIDFDRFKAINDSLGHDAGDELLRNIATRIQGLRAFAQPLQLQGFRLGGDEFVLVLDGPNAHHDIRLLAEQSLDLFAQPHRLMNQDCVSTASIGIVTCQEAQLEPNLILRNADLAMMHAKEAGKSQIVVFDQEMVAQVQRRQRIERDLRVALQEDTLEVRYQAIYRADSLDIEAIEALLFWEHEQLGHITNQELLDIAEESGIIHQLGTWVMDTVAHDVDANDGQNPSWLSDPRFGGSRVHVNVSHAEVVHPGFIKRFQALLQDHPALRERLCLECPASVLGRAGETFQTVIAALHAQGVLFALDHLDREQVSLTQLATLPLDALKVGVPHSLADRDLSTQKYAAVLQAITLFAQHRNIRVVGTAVQHDDQIAVATSSNVSSIQGNLLRQVVTLDELRDQPMPDTLANALDGILDQIPGLVA